MTARQRVHVRDDRGAATAWMLILIPVVLAAIGFVLDAGLAIRDWNTAHSQAAAAARSGAAQINLTAYRSGHRLRLNPAVANAAATRYLNAAHLSGTVAATTTTVTVTVTHTTRTQLLGLIGIGTLTETATVTATPLHGVTGPLP